MIINLENRIIIKMKGLLVFSTTTPLSHFRFYVNHLNLTAVPYAMISAALCMMDEVAKRMQTIASAPRRLASSTIRSVAIRRALSIISLYFVSSPPTRVLSPAPMSRSAFTVWMVLPLTMPSGSSCLRGMVSVVTINKFAHLHFPE